ncbi:MAG: hypothetical protein FK733_02965 [Asgard group archaeon]|nr:hypothetical protein [Asgard group archaeon]
MPENAKQSDQQTDTLTDDTTFVEKEKKITWRSFLKISGFTITFVVISLVLMIVGLILFYKTSSPLKGNAGYWMILAGVILFLLTVIFGFEKIE